MERLRSTAASAGAAAPIACALREIDLGLRVDWLSFDDTDRRDRS